MSCGGCKIKVDYYARLAVTKNDMGKGGEGTWSQVWELHMLDQDRTTTSFRYQNMSEDRGVVLTYVRMSTSYDQPLSKGRLQKTTSILALVQRGDRQRSHHGTVSPSQCC